MRHRIASYNEQSGRYMEMEPVFYIPDVRRPLVQKGKPGEYTFVDGTEAHRSRVHASIVRSSTDEWEQYQRLLSYGIAKEVARMVLPLNIYSTAYVTINLRSLMNFLSLRTRDEASTFPSYPQYEIEMVAKTMEKCFAELYPLTHEAFVLNGRVAP